jgi:hypothetical protein
MPPRDILLVLRTIGYGIKKVLDIVGSDLEGGGYQEKRYQKKDQ